MSDTPPAKPRRAPPPPARPAAGPPAVAAREVELRLTVAPADLPRIPGLAPVRALAAAEPKRARQHTTYYDTPDLALAGRGVALRLRRTGGTAVQGIKTFGPPGGPPGGQAGGAAAVAVRQEWEWPVRDGLDLEALSDPELEHLVPAGLRPGLRPVIATDVQRTIVPLRVPPQGLIELCLDQGQITAMPASGAPLHKPVSEIELELKSGRLADLFAIAADIHSRAPLRLQARSKAHDGFALLTGRGPGAVAARPIGLSPATTVAEAFRHIGRNALAQLLENEPALLAGGDADALREMAAAARRLDAGFGLFKAQIACPQGAALRAGLRRFGAVLAEARWWERVAETVEATGARGGPLPPAFAATLAGRRRAARLAALDLLRAPAWTAWVLEFAGWLEGGDWARAPHLDAPMADHAVRLLTARFAKVAGKAGSAAAAPDAKAYAKLRRRIDKLRYAVDFLRSLLPADRVRPAHAALTAFRVALRTRAELHAALALVTAARDAAEREARTEFTKPRGRLAKAAAAADAAVGDGWTALDAAWPWRD